MSRRGAWWRLWPAWLLPAAVVALNMVWLTGLRGGLLGRDAVLARQVEQLEEQLKQLEAQHRQVTRDDQALAQLQASLEQLRGRDLGPMKERLVPFLIDMLARMGEAGLRPERISYGASLDEKTGLTRFSASYSVAGTYDQIRRAIYQLETSPQFVTIESVGLRGETQATSLAVEVQMTIATYFSDADGALLAAVGRTEASGDR
ncbi:MAG: type 4a pilus biogenesis protein PilO [Acidobacteriota bacterium]